MKKEKSITRAVIQLAALEVFNQVKSLVNVDFLKGSSSLSDYVILKYFIY